MRHIRAALAATTAALAAWAGPAAAQIITAAPTYDAAPGKLSAGEVRTLFAGKHEEAGVDTTGRAWTITVTPTGTATLESGAYRDTGHLSIKANAVCVSWAKAWNGEEHCFHYAHHGDQLASYGSDGALNSTLSISR